MGWDELLEARIDALGASPTDDQQDNLVSWVMEHVPHAYVRSVAYWMPSHLSTAYTQLTMRASELGF